MIPKIYHYGYIIHELQPWDHDGIIKWKHFPRHWPFVRGAPGEFPAQRPVTRNFDVIFDRRPNKRLNKQWWGWWFETPSCPQWRPRNAAYLGSSRLPGVVKHSPYWKPRFARMPMLSSLVGRWRFSWWPTKALALWPLCIDLSLPALTGGWPLTQPIYPFSRAEDVVR